MAKAIFILIFFLSTIQISHAATMCDTKTYKYTEAQCENIKMEKFSSQLENLYQHIKERLKENKEAEEQFTKAQKSWLNFIYDECVFQSVNGKSLGETIYAKCKNSYIQERIKAFNLYLSCPKGDTTCPVPYESVEE